MVGKRLKAIAKMVDKNDIVLDVGCDHGYLSILLKNAKMSKEVYASDISPSALKIAEKNFHKYHTSIRTFLSDGFTDINVKFNTAVIAGMGTHTILHILDYPSLPAKLIIASNNDYYLLRCKLNAMGYKITKEEAIFENNHYYVILQCFKGYQQLKRKELLYGISHNNDYYQYQIAERKKIMPQVPFGKKIKLEKECLELKMLIGRK